MRRDGLKQIMFNWHFPDWSRVCDCSSIDPGFLSTRCQYNRLACDYRYYVALNTTDGTKLPIHIEYPPCKNLTIAPLMLPPSHSFAVTSLCEIICFNPCLFSALSSFRSFYRSKCSFISFLGSTVTSNISPIWTACPFTANYISHLLCICLTSIYFSTSYISFPMYNCMCWLAPQTAPQELPAREEVVWPFLPGPSPLFLFSYSSSSAC